MNSVIEAQQEFLTFCPWNLKSDLYIRLTNIHYPSFYLKGSGFFGGGRDYEREQEIDKQNAILNKLYHLKKESSLLDQQRHV